MKLVHDYSYLSSTKHDGLDKKTAEAHISYERKHAEDEEGAEGHEAHEGVCEDPSRRLKRSYNQSFDEAEEGEEKTRRWGRKYPESPGS